MAEVFPFKPNWAEGYEVLMAYKTDIFTSRSGKEQRRALRSTPRRTVTYSAMTHGSDMVAFQRLMATKQNADFHLPDWSRFVRTEGVEAGATHFSIRSISPPWLVAGATVFLIDGDTVASATIASASSHTVALTAPSPQTFSGGTVLRPTFDGLLGSLATTSNTSNLVTVNVSFDVTPGSVPNSADVFAPWVVAGKEVFGFNWNWGEAVSTDYQWSVEQVDFQRGVTTTYRPLDFGTVVQKATLVRQTEQVGAITRFVERQKGQRGEFWMPSGTADMELLSNISNGSASFTVAGSDLYEKFSLDPVYTGVALYLRDGRKVFRKINSIGLSGGNSIVNLSVAATFAIPTTLVAKISWMRPARFASDEQTIEYLTDDVAQLQVTTTTVTFGTDTQDYAELDGAGNWTMDSWGEDSEATMDAIDYMVNIALPFGNVAELPLGAFDDFINSEMWTALT